jgi:sulfofructose kinase
MAAEFDVICVGAANLDTIVPVERVPLDDERMVSPGFLTAGGGPAATAAVTLARLGVRVAFCGVVGDDAAGRVTTALLDQDGVDIRWVRIDPGASTARAVVLTSRSTGGRSIITTVAPAPSTADVPVDRSEWLHVDQIGYAATAAAIQETGSAVRLSIDAGNPVDGLSVRGAGLYAPTLAALFDRFDTEDVALALQRAVAEGAERVVATAGSVGTYVGTEHGFELVPAFAVEVVSTLGAGDVFHGALLAGLVEGRDLVASTAFANAVAALSCRRIDGRTGIPTRTEADEFLESTWASGISRG